MLTSCDKDDDDDNGGASGKISDPTKIDPSKYDNTTERCWELTASYGSYSESGYEWGTEAQIVTSIKRSLEYMEVDGVSYSYKQASPTSEDACDALEEEKEAEHDANRACYKVSGRKGGVIEEGYVWATQEELNAMKQMAAQEGVTNISAQKTNFPDEDACDESDEEING